MQNLIRSMILECWVTATMKFILFIYRVKDTAARQLTKTAITVTGIFIVALGYDLWYYVLGYAGIIEYKMNTPIQKIGKSARTADSLFTSMPFKAF